jgi:hypothetical protein
MREDSNKVKDFIKKLFTGSIKVKYCGSNYTRLCFFDNNGNCVKTLKYVTGPYLKVGCKTKVFEPIYADK